MKTFRLVAPLALATLLSCGGAAIAQDAPKPDAPKPEQPKADKKEEGREGRRNRRNRGRRGGRGFGGMDLGAMQKELGLTDDQMAKMKTMQQDAQKAGREMWQKMREQRENGGGGDRSSMREMFQKMRAESEKKLSEILTPEQMKKMKKFRENQRSRWQGRGRRNRGQNRERNFKQLRDEALKALKLSEEEAAVLVPMLDGVLETKKLLVAEAEKRRKAFLESVRKTTGETELSALLKDYRSARAQDRATLKKAQNKLVEALTPEQEALLVAMNVVD
jgi:Spy/CpxP family protein refolding chaperone